VVHVLPASTSRVRGRFDQHASPSGTAPGRCSLTNPRPSRYFVLQVPPALWQLTGSSATWAGSSGTESHFTCRPGISKEIVAITSPWSEFGVEAVGLRSASPHAATRIMNADTDSDRMSANYQIQRRRTRLSARGRASAHTERRRSAARGRALYVSPFAATQSEATGTALRTEAIRAWC
jgi:hypothetical protein